MVLQNSFTDYKGLGDESLNVELYSDGEVLWFPFQVIHCSTMYFFKCLNIYPVDIIQHIAVAVRSFIY